MPAKSKGANEGVIAFRPDQALRDALAEAAERNQCSIHEEAKQRVISTLGKDVSSKGETLSGLKESLRVIEQKLEHFAKHATGPAPELLSIQDQLRNHESIIKSIAQDTAVLAYLLVAEPIRMNETTAREWVKKHIATHAIGKMSHES